MLADQRIVISPVSGWCACSDDATTRGGDGDATRSEHSAMTAERKSDTETDNWQKVSIWE